MRARACPTEFVGVPSARVVPITKVTRLVVGLGEGSAAHVNSIIGMLSFQQTDLAGFAGKLGHRLWVSSYVSRAMTQSGMMIWRYSLHLILRERQRSQAWFRRLILWLLW